MTTMATALDSAMAIGFRSCGCRSSFPSASQGCRSSFNLSTRRQRFLVGGASDRRDPKQASDGIQRVCSARACAVQGDSGESNRRRSYHPFEEITEQVLPNGEDARLTVAEAARTIIEVNIKATLIFSGLIDDEFQENIVWPDLPYLTDEHGDVYFEMKDNEEILQSLIAGDKLVQVVIGLDNIDILMEMDLSGPSNYNFGIDDITNEDSDSDSDEEYEEDVVTILEDEDDDTISSEALNDWANLDTMNTSHPLRFARKIAEVVSNVHSDWMEQPSASIVVQGILRPAFVEEHTFVRKQPLDGSTGYAEMHHHEENAEDNLEVLDKDQKLHGGTAFYKLEMINILLISTCGSQAVVKIQDFRKAPPDVIAHSAANIISRLKSGGETTIQALKSLCWRHKGIHVQEAALTGVDSLGFDLRVCSGTQVQTLRFAFNTRATSELSAEKQLRDLLFPRLQQKQRKYREPHQNEC